MKNSYRAAIVFAIVICIGLVAFYRPGGSESEGNATIVTPADDQASSPAAMTPDSTTPRTPPTSTGAGASAATSTSRSPQTVAGQTGGSSERRTNSLEDLVGDVLSSIPSKEEPTDATATSTGTAGQTEGRRPTLSGSSATPSETATTGSTTGLATPPPAVGAVSGGDVRPVGTGSATAATTRNPTTTTGTPPRPVAVTPPSPPRTITPTPTPATTASRTYSIRSGDTFSSIAEDEFGSQKYWFEIAQANPTVDPAKLKIGQVIRLPNIDTTAPATSTDTRPDFGPGSGQEYIVRPEDTLSSIARQFYNDPDKWRMLHDVNRTTIGSDPNRLKVGMKLRIPPPQNGAN